MPTTRTTRRSSTPAAAAAAAAATSLTERSAKSSGGIEVVTSEPVLIGEGRFSPKFRMTVFEAVDYLGTRFRIGDHVSMYTPDGLEWVCVLEALYKEKDTNVAMFIGRWFWSVEDVQAQEDLHKEVMRPSKCPSHELLACDSRDSNKVESISRKCHVLSYDNFQLVKKIILKNDYNSEKIYFCQRQFYHIAYRFSELSSILFPGDPIPLALRKAAGLPMDDDDHHQSANSEGNCGAILNSTIHISNNNDNVTDTANAYFEPDYSANTKRKKDKIPNVSSDPIIICVHAVFATNHVCSRLVTMTYEPQPSKFRSGKAISGRVSKMESFKVMDVMRVANALEKTRSESDRSIIHLEVGQPSEPPPTAVVSALQTSDPRSLSYSPALGLNGLREAVAKHYHRRYNVFVSSEDIAVACGASGVFVALFATCFDKGDRVAIASPGYPCYRHVLRALDVDVDILPTCAKTNFQPTLMQVENIAQDIQGLILASPGNPTGSTLSLEELTSFAKLCRAHGITLIVDEVYHGISRSFTASALQVEDNLNNNHTNHIYDDNMTTTTSTSTSTSTAPLVVVGSMSKYWCMTGFRIGWAATRNAQVIQGMEKCIQNMAICAPTPCQHAAIVALNGDHDEELNALVQRYFSAADQLIERLKSVAFEVHLAQGAFYLYANCGQVCRTVNVKGATELCHVLLHQVGVACTSGVDFDEERGEHFIRFSCAGKEEDVVEAGDRIVQFVSQSAVK